ncbi:ABC transporter ATP-binding protein/permease [Falsiroseomonas ponticola]|uniref:ABC transporter ATP-binding protein/permease n=1 Tax=Falsiroseomonas ponticola TaxID=2786951 RepID=UPI001932808F|nr:ABC transporter ATP-binding protein/permease [Roseomonas ponticola]
MAVETEATSGDGALRETWRLARGWYGAAPWTAWGLTAVAVVLTLLQIALSYAFSDWQRDAFDALEKRDADAFQGQLWWFVALTLLSMAVAVGRLWARQVLAFLWRRWLVLKLQGAMLANHRHYRMEMGEGGADNPDQRIGENTRWATIMTVDLVLGLLHSVALFACFAGLLWHLSGTLELAIGGTVIALPGSMLIAAALYSGLGALVVWRVGRAMPRIHLDRNQAEADHRFALLRIREHSEGIALIRGEADEERGLARAYRGVEAAMLRLLRSERQLMWLGAGYMAVAGVLPLLLGAPRFFAGAITLGVLMQMTQAFVEVTRALSWFVENWPRLADWRGHVVRVVELERACEAADGQAGAPGIVIGAGEALALTGLSLGTACGRALVAEAAVTLRPGERVLVTGESGSGKSTLFRAIAGIWPWGQGGIAVPDRAATLFMPQRPYLPLGSLRAALAYPAAADAFPAEAAAAALRRCRLGALVPQLDKVSRWDRVLSLGEQQRLAFARLLLHRPRWVFMDEATSALDEANQAAMFALFQAELAGAALLSIGHRPGLDRYHDRVLALRPAPGGARLERVVPAASLWPVEAFRRGAA